MSAEGYHESPATLDAETIEMHRALQSMVEEIHAMDWYNQRISASDREELTAILRHNRDEEKEHFSLLLEWVRRNDPAMDRHLRTYLFTSGDLLALEEGSGGVPPGRPSP